MMSDAVADGLVLRQFSLNDHWSVDWLAALRQDIASGQIVILKGAVEPGNARALRDMILAWRDNQPCVPFTVDTNGPGINFHRIDADPTKSQLPHRFHQHGFGAVSDLPADLRTAILKIAGRMLMLQNAVAQTEYHLDMPEVRVKVLQYPQGGGFLANHAHPLRPQQVGLILALAEAGTDYINGGTTFVTPRGTVDTGPQHNLGDLILFRYDLQHAVTPVDEDKPLSWAAPGGRWTLVLELLTTHARSEAT